MNLDQFDNQDIKLVPETFKSEKMAQEEQTKKSYKLYCDQHNKEIVMFDLTNDENIKNRKLCVVCLQNRKGNFKSLNEVSQLWQDFTKQYCNFCQSSFEATLDEIRPLIKLLQVYEGEVSNRIIKFNRQIQEHISRISYEQEVLMNDLFDLPEFLELHSIKINKILQNLSQQDFLQFKKEQQMNKLKVLANYTENQLRNLLEAKEHAEDYFSRKLNELNFVYQVDNPDNSSGNYKEISPGLSNKNVFCGAMALSKNQQLLIAGCKNLINIYRFEQGRISLKQQLDEHQSNVIKLCFMDTTQKFVSIDAQAFLIIWTFSDNQWDLEQRINAIHSDQIQCLLFSEINNEIITGSSDKYIKFIVNHKKKWCVSQTLQIHEGSVLDMTLNNYQNILVSCGYVKPGFFSRSEGQINISEKNTKGKWQVMQKIKSDSKVNRVSFIDQNIIIYQTKTNLVLLGGNSKNVFEQRRVIFNIDDNTNIFPLFFSSTKNWLIFKNKNIVSVIINEQGVFQYKQIIMVQSDNFIGTLSEDGTYLIIWDSQSKQIKVRKSQ